MRSQYSFMVDKGTITFWSNDVKLMSRVQDYIETLLDAERYRRQLEDIRRAMLEEEEDGLV